MKKHLTVALAMFSVMNAAQSAVVVSNNSVSLTQSGSNYALSPNGGTTIFFSKVDNSAVRTSTLTPYDTTADAGVDVYLVKSGDVLSAVALAQSSYPIMSRVPSPAVFSPISVPYLVAPSLRYFYLGFNFDDYSNENYADFLNRKAFGWARFENTNSNGLRLDSSAVVYGASGIIVGTNDFISPVPLPAAAWLMLSGIGALGAAARRRKAA